MTPVLNSQAVAQPGFGGGGTEGLGAGSPAAGCPGAEPLVGSWGEAPRKLTAYYGYLAAKPCTILCI